MKKPTIFNVLSLIFKFISQNYLLNRIENAFTQVKLNQISIKTNIKFESFTTLP